jgi:hypothetical protein
MYSFGSQPAFVTNPLIRARATDYENANPMFVLIPQEAATSARPQRA